jgi:quinolinate synthase
LCDKARDAVNEKNDMPRVRERVLDLREQKDAIILAHYYQRPEIQEVADMVGDSLALAKRASETEASTIMLAGVHFMAETAKILAPEKEVLLPDLDAGCSLADSCPPDAFKEFLEAHPDHEVVTYINCSAEVTAMSDRICTSSNAREVIGSIPEDRPILFAPDKNLGRYLSEVTGRDMLLWDGVCSVHEAFSMERIMKLMGRYPGAQLLAHPESEEAVLKLAHYVASTGKMLKYVQESERERFIVATEWGILHKMRELAPDKELIPAPSHEDNTCACSECAFMKVNTLQKLQEALEHGQPRIELSETVRRPAHRALMRMFPDRRKDVA